MVHAGITKDEPIKAKRRTVVRGAAWSVPVVAAAATAPAFATSPMPPKFKEVVVCKLPGRSTDVAFGYFFKVPYNGTYEQLSIDALTLNNKSRTAECINVRGGFVEWVVKSTNSADGSGEAIITISFNGEQLDPIPFEYNGTKPCKGETGACE